MSSGIYLESCQETNIFFIRFYNTNITICLHQLMSLLGNIQANDSQFIDLGLLWTVDNELSDTLPTKPEYRICFGRTILLLSQRDMVEFMAQLWETNPMLMHWFSSEEQVCS